MENTDTEILSGRLNMVWSLHADPQENQAIQLPTIVHPKSWLRMYLWILDHSTKVSKQTTRNVTECIQIVKGQTYVPVNRI